jgi:hypothetical protein
MAQDLTGNSILDTHHKNSGALLRRTEAGHPLTGEQVG